MNRYIEDGILSDALRGKRIVMVHANRTESRAAFQSLTARTAPVTKARRANGRERIEYAGGGSIDFLTPLSVRGHSADVVLVHGWNDLSEDQRCDTVAMTLARQGEVIRA